jgi:signal transduction histidine kinase
LRVKHQAGSLDLEVAGARHRNLAITCAALLLMALSSAALVVFLRRAEELNRMQMDFVAGVSHELRTPLAVIRSAGENLADGVVAADKTSNYGALVRDEGRRLSSMVEQILRFAGVESGRAPYTFAAVPVARLIDRAIDDSSAALENVVVEKQIEDALPNVIADEASISHCLQNLLGNAVKYGDGKWVKVEAARHGSFVEFAVADRGPGVDPSEKRSVFNPFFRGKRAIDNQIHGLGIGLSLVRRVAETHGGSVAVTNQPLGGARFSLLIPVEP